jgi:hypothetical protein
MPKWFNTAGPCKPDIHYMLSPLDRLPNLERLVAQRGYFVIHAPRQTGKTTAMLTLAQHCISNTPQKPGQVFSPEAVQRAFNLTQGQPWLVNALARQMVEVIAPDPS